MSIRQYIDLVESASNEEFLEEKFGKLGSIAAAAALLGGSNIPKAEAEPTPIPQTQEVNQINREDLKLLALTMWGEARGDGPDAMRAVGHVIMNRVESDRFGSSIKDVVWKRKAFSCWNKNDPNRNAMQNISSLPEGKDKERWEQAQMIAHEILSGNSNDLTSGAIFYHTTNVSPYWVDPDVDPTAKIANHVFYNQDRKA